MLSNQVALVTGGAGDLGNAMAYHLAKAGADVVIWDVKPRTETQFQMDRVREFDTKVTYSQVDVADREAVDSAIASLDKLDIVCSNAGIVEALPFLEVTQDNWQRHIDINLTGCFNVCQSSARKIGF